MFKTELTADTVTKNWYTAKTNGQYPDLAGTDKQVAWAEKIRRQYVADMINKLNKALSVHIDKVDDSMENIKSILCAIEKIVNQNTDAKFWIENRSNLVSLTKKYK